MSDTTAPVTDGVVDPSRLKDLQEQIQGFVRLYQYRHARNYWVSVMLVALGILLGLAVTAAGFLGAGVVAGLLGLAITAFISFQKAFAFDETAEFQRLLFTEAENLLNLLHYRVKTQIAFDSVLDAFMTLKKHAATNLPKGKGM